MRACTLIVEAESGIFEYAYGVSEIARLDGDCAAVTGGTICFVE